MSLLPRLKAEHVNSIFGRQSSMRPANASAENPAKTTCNAIKIVD
jgi:hypothetical protein